MIRRGGSRAARPPGVALRAGVSADLRVPLSRKRLRPVQIARSWPSADQTEDWLGELGWTGGGPVSGEPGAPGDRVALAERLATCSPTGCASAASCVAIGHAA